MVVKEGSVFSLQIWGRVSSPQTQGKGVKLPLFLIMYVLKYFFPFNFGVECHLPKLQCCRIQKIFTSML